jgi:hypothetical protein
VPELEFLANMNISPLTVEALRKEGINIIRVSEVLEGEVRMRRFWLMREPITR